MNKIRSKAKITNVVSPAPVINATEIKTIEIITVKTLIALPNASERYSKIAIEIKLANDPTNAPTLRIAIVTQ